MTFALLQLRFLLSSVLPHRDDDRGASLVEYALLLALIAAVCVIALGMLGNAASGGLEKGADGFATN